MLDKYSAYNVLAEGMHFSDKCIFCTEAAYRISTFSTFLCLSEVVQIPHVIFEIRSQICINFVPFCNILAKT